MRHSICGDLLSACLPPLTSLMNIISGNFPSPGKLKTLWAIIRPVLEFLVVRSVGIRLKVEGTGQERSAASVLGIYKGGNRSGGRPMRFIFPQLVVSLRGKKVKLRGTMLVTHRNGRSAEARVKAHGTLEGKHLILQYHTRELGDYKIEYHGTSNLLLNGQNELHGSFTTTDVDDLGALMMGEIHLKPYTPGNVTVMVEQARLKTAA